MTGLWGGVGLLGIIPGLATAPLVDRYGPRRFMVTGFSLIGVGFIVVSVVNAVWMLNLASILVGLGLGLGLFVAPYAAVANWFSKRTCLALAVVLLGSVLGSSTVTRPVIERLISSVGWPWAALTIGVVTLVVGIPLALVMRHKPEQYGHLPDGKAEGIRESAAREDVLPAGVNFTTRQAINSRAFWLLTIAVAIGGNVAVMGSSIVVNHWVGFGPSAAITDILGTASQIRVVAGVAMVLVFGYLGDRFSKRYLRFIALAFQGASFAPLFSRSISAFYLHTAVSSTYGFMPLIYAIRADYFGRKSFATIAASMGVGIGLLGIPIQYLVVVGSQTPGVLGLVSPILICFIGAAVFYLARAPQPPRRPHPA